MNTLVFLDLETTGLDPVRHKVWEMAYALEDGDVMAATVTHNLDGADTRALELNRYEERVDRSRLRLPAIKALLFEADVLRALTGATVVAANPAFDTSFLRARWGESPWHHRLLDIETYAMPLFSVDRPIGFANLCARLGIEFEHHSAAEDVRALRECWRELRKRYESGTE